MVTYWPATRCGFINFDDNVYVYDNPHIKAGLTWAAIKWSFAHSVSSNWHPLTLMSYTLDYQLYGLNAWGYHLTNLLLHSLNAALIFALLWQMTRTTWRSFFVAALFALHPLRVESVAWIAERKDVLSAFFGFLSLIFYVSHAHRLRAVGNQKNSIIFTAPYFLSFLFFTLGLMSKPMLVTWPFVMLLLDGWPLDRFRVATNPLSNSRILLIEKVPYLAIVAASSVVTFMVQKNTGAVVRLESIPLGLRVANAIISYSRYIGTAFWPVDLAIIYPHPGAWPLVDVLSAAALLLGISALAVIQRRRWPFLLTGWFWFLGTLVPVIGLVQVGSQSMADRYTYIPSVGLLILIIWGTYELARRSRPALATFSTFGCIAAIACVALTRHQLTYWRDSETIFRHALAVTQDNYIAHCNLGSALEVSGRYDEAKQHFYEVLRISPSFPNGHYGLALCLGKQGQSNQAIDQFQIAARQNPAFTAGHADLGIELLKVGRLPEATTQLQEALLQDPDLATAHNGMGTLLSDQRQIPQAIAEFRQAIRLKPEFAEARYNLALNLSRLGDTDAAIAAYQQAIRLDPALPDAQNDLGLLLAAKGRTADAIPRFEAAVRLKPDFAAAHNNLGTALAIQGRLPEAIRQFQEAVRLSPDDPAFRRNLDRALGNAPRLPAPSL